MPPDRAQAGQAPSDWRADQRSGRAEVDRATRELPDRRSDEARPGDESDRGGADASLTPHGGKTPDDLGAQADLLSGADGLPTAAQLAVAALPVVPVLALPVPTPMPAASTDAARASLLQLSAYVERLLVEAAPRAGQTPAAEITLSADLFVDTALSIARRDGGWLLRVRSADGRLLDQMEACESALRERFARRGLGDLAVEWVD
jgi:hypothetical protein